MRDVSIKSLRESIKREREKGYKEGEVEVAFNYLSALQALFFYASPCKSVLMKLSFQLILTEMILKTVTL